MPSLVLNFLRPIVSYILPDLPAPPLANSSALTLVPLAATGSSYSGVVVFLGIAILASSLVFIIHRLASHRMRRSAPWDCGFPDPRPETQYTASSFAQPIRRAFGSVVFRARESVDMPVPGDLRAARIKVTQHDLVWEKLYEPVVRFVASTADKVDAFQFLSVRRYLAIVFLTLVVLLILVVVMP
jgi:hypothetical protein